MFIDAQRTTSAKQKIDIRIFDKSYTPSEEEVERKLAQAVLTERGYKKTTAFTQIEEDDISESFKKAVRYRKSVPCKDMARVEEELRRSMPGIWGRDVSVKVREEAAKKREKDQRCTAGIEIHFPSKSCRQRNKKLKRAIAACANPDICMMCFFATVQ